MTSSYVRTSVRPSVRPYDRTDYGGGEGSLAVTLTGKRKNLFLTGFLKNRKLISVCCQQTIAEVDLTFLRWGCTEAKRKKIIIKITTERHAEAERRTSRKRSVQCKGRRPNSTEQCESKAWGNTAQCREAKLTRAIERRRNTGQTDPEHCRIRAQRCCAAGVQGKSHDMIIEKNQRWRCMFWGITNSKHSGKRG